ncbi:unnamed protein product [Ectocarpus sp. 8 AP-2014]
MKGLLKQFKNNVRFPTKDGGGGGGSDSTKGGTGGSTSTNTGKHGTSTTANGAMYGTGAAGATAAAATGNGRPGGNGAAWGADPPPGGAGDANGGGGGVRVGDAGQLEALSGGGGAAGGGGGMPPPPPKGTAGMKGPVGAQLQGGIVAPSSSTPTLINGVEDTPVADPELPRRASTSLSRRSTSFESSRSSDITFIRQEFMKELPLLRTIRKKERSRLYRLKFRWAGVRVRSVGELVCPGGDKEVKRCTLLELVEYINSTHGQQPDDCDPDKDEPLLEEAWPHLQVVYEFLVRFVVSSEVDAKQAKQYVDQAMCLQLVDLFDSEDPRERDYLKTILHRVYGKFMMHRAFIRRAVGNAFLRFVYECPRHNGIGELLEILGSIVNGFATPLKKEHVDFLQVCLLPLHTPTMVNIYHQQLSYCVVQYVEKEADTATHILKSLIRFWPWRSSSKQVIFINELEEVLELLAGPDQIAEVEDQLFNLLARCISSEHFQVAERALFLWNNEHLVTAGVLSMQYPSPLLPVIYGPLRERSTRHWNTTVEGLAHNVLRMYNDQDAAAFERCHQQHVAEEEERGRRRAKADAHWALLEELAQLKAGE